MDQLTPLAKKHYAGKLRKLTGSPESCYRKHLDRIDNRTMPTSFMRIGDKRSYGRVHAHDRCIYTSNFLYASRVDSGSSRPYGGSYKNWSAISNDHMTLSRSYTLSARCAIVSAVVDGHAISQKIIAPKNWRWMGDRFLHSSGEDYHPTQKEIFCEKTVWKNKLSQNLAVRRAIKTNEKKASLVLEGKRDIVISYTDSVTAGNCLQGTVRFCEKTGLWTGLASELLRYARLGACTTEQARRTIVAGVLRAQQCGYPVYTDKKRQF